MNPVAPMAFVMQKGSVYAMLDSLVYSVPANVTGRRLAVEMVGVRDLVSVFVTHATLGQTARCCVAELEHVRPTSVSAMAAILGSTASQNVITVEPASFRQIHVHALPTGVMPSARKKAAQVLT
ncbi:hypothetical protein DPMN_003923 [Dreissena polymorpha]|uniref:Uncharacterized protein n=1 Tax=Dreissena polymorpha TaxID=45954 RepID=A0A9D4MPC2_DREPO|nr:hypothetical protein DPMN_003923 [Dreissena polymorpha]